MADEDHIADIVQLPGKARAEAPPMPTEGDLGFEDIEAAFNMRDWLQRVVEGAGAKVVGSGMGFGAGDLWIELDGCEFMVSIKPITK